MINTSYINGESCSDEDVSAALGELGSRLNLGSREVSQLVLSRVSGDRSSAANWAAAIAKVASERLTPAAAQQRRLQRAGLTSDDLMELSRAVADQGAEQSLEQRSPDDRLFDDDTLQIGLTREDHATELELGAIATDVEVARLSDSNPATSRYFGKGSAGPVRHSSGEDQLRTPGCRAEIMRLSRSVNPDAEHHTTAAEIARLTEVYRNLK